MLLEMLTGASGHGKTYELYQDMIANATQNPEKRYLLIVPEQSSLQAQKNIVRMHANHGVFNIDVLTFGRLAYRVFEELGIELPETIDENGKNLLVRKVLDEVAGELKIIHPSRHQGFIGDIKSMLSELKQYGMKPEDLKNFIDSLTGEDRLKDKLTDIYKIYTAFEKALENRFVTAEDKPELLLNAIDRSDFLKGTVVALDGFTGFTPVQYRLLSHMLQVCEKVTISVTLPENEDYNVIREEELFFMSKDMIRRASRLADEYHIPVQVRPLKTDRENFRFAKAPELDFLEQNIFRYNKAHYEGKPEAISIRMLSDAAEEVSYVAADLLRRVRRQELRYRDIALVAGDLSLYSAELVRVFKEAGIPYFLDEKRSLLGNPLVECIRGALALLRDNASYETMFRFLKNELVPIEEDRLDSFENYVLSLGIRGLNSYQEKFIRKYPGKANAGMGLEDMNATREEVMALLAEFVTAMKTPKATVADYVLAVYSFMEKLDAYEKMESLAASFEEGETVTGLAKAAEYRRCYGQVIGLLERIHALLGEEELSLAEFADVCDAGFDSIKVGIIPPSSDCVTIGDLKRTRLEDVKVLYVLGLNEGIIPQVEDVRSVLSEQERNKLQEKGAVLAPTARQRIYEQNFYLYLNLTEPEQSLILTYHAMNEEGSKARPSRLVHMLTNMYSNILKEGPLSQAEILNGPGNALHLATKLTQKKMGQDYQNLLGYLWQKPESKAAILRLLKAYEDDCAEDELTAKTAAELYKELTVSSVSRMEDYAGCAFKQFADYGLDLEERQLHQLDNQGMGNIFHEVLKRLGGDLKAEGRDFGDLTEEERLSRIAKFMDEVAVDYGNSVFKDSKSNEFLRDRLIQILNQTVWALGEQLKAGDFKPVDFEQPFKQTFEGMDLVGKIDRIDIAEDDENIYVKIIDYKSSVHKLDYSEVYTGLQLQLMVYLQDTLDRLGKEHPNKKIIAAGTLYNQVGDPLAEAQESAEASEEALLDVMRPEGAYNAQGVEYFDRTCAGPSRESHYLRCKTDKAGLVAIKGMAQPDEHLKELAAYATDKLYSMTHEMNEGRIKAEPYRDSCKYCPYSSLCGFTRPNHSGTYRNKLKLKEDELWAAIIKTEGEEAVSDEMDE